MERIRRKRMELALTVLGLLLACGAVGAQERTLVGTAVYGTITNETDASGASLEVVDATRYLVPDSPVPFVRVELRDGSNRLLDWTITDENGDFSLMVSGTPELKIRTKARNDYVRVKKEKGILNLETNGVVFTDRLLIDFPWHNCPEGGTCSLGPLPVVDDTVDTFVSPFGQPNFKSRAFYLATAVHSMGRLAENLVGRTLPGENVVVRFGIRNQAVPHYNAVINTIYLRSRGATTIWHEYGHFIEDKLGGFSPVPPYGSHAQCNEITDSLSSDPNLCWAWFEGFATWWGAVGAQDYHGPTFDELLRTFASTSIFDHETNVCTVPQVNAWQDPLAVESIVTNVLWDLIDDSEATTPQNTVNPSVPEVAEIPTADVMAVLAAEVPSHFPCTLHPYEHPVRLDEFWDEYRAQHPGVVPDLYAAYAFNGVDIGNAADTGRPDGLYATTDTHIRNRFSANPNVTLRIEDGDDDVSGSYYYFLREDDQASTEVTVMDPLNSTFDSKQTENTWEHRLQEGSNRFLHLNSLDLALNIGLTTTHVGPFHIDISAPTFVETPQPTADEKLILGYMTDFQWEVRDPRDVDGNPLSGLDAVRIDYLTSTGLSFNIADRLAAGGNLQWRVEGLPAPSQGIVRYTAWDMVGNTSTQDIPVSVVPPFVSQELSLDIDDAAVIAADLDGDGDDEVVMGTIVGLAGEVMIFGGRNEPIAQLTDVVSPWSPVEDLYAADVDLDGDLDVVTVSRAMGGAPSFVEVLENNGTGRLRSNGVSAPLGGMTAHIVRVFPRGKSGRPTIAVFGERPGPIPQPEAAGFDYAAGMARVTLGVDPMIGDWEAADIDQDGYVDLISLGSDWLGAAGLRLFLGEASGFDRRDLALYGAAGSPDLDLGDFNADGLLDLFVMFDDGPGRITKLIQQTPTGFIDAESASLPDYQIAQGDGRIADIENDGASEVVATGVNSVMQLSGWYLRNSHVVGFVQADRVPLIEPLRGSDSAWGDFDNDGDVEPFMVGEGMSRLRILIYESLLGDHLGPNDRPAAPKNLSSTYDAALGGYRFSWDAPGVHEDETPEDGFGYELRIGTSLGGSDRLSWTFQAGPSLHGSGFERFVELPPGVYFAEVRTVDSGWKRSAGAATHQTSHPGMPLP